MVEEFTEIDPYLGQKKKDFVPFCNKLINIINTRSGKAPLNDLRSSITPKEKALSKEEARFFLAANVMLDLAGQGWKIRTVGESVAISPPIFDGLSSVAIKDVIRERHLVERDEQLREPSVAAFIEKMERGGLNGNGSHSIYSLMRDGGSLAADLRQAASISDNDARQEKLKSVIMPYIEFVEPNKRCAHTGLLLQDIWRYFRHTWVNAYKSLPGRSIQILIRDAAAPNHPIIGIAALGSSVVQQATRDQWIGWDASSFVKETTRNPTVKKARWLLASLDDLIRSIYAADLIEEQICNRHDMSRPTETVIEKLKEESARSRRCHTMHPNIGDYKSQRIMPGGKIDWEKKAKLHLFRSKRCLALASLLSIRRAFQEAGFSVAKKTALRTALEFKSVRDAVGQLVRLKKAENVGIHMMDITVCGSVAPYNLILGGKLVSMLMCSPGVIRYYQQRYASQESVIASSVKGSPVVKEPRLVYLGTTSLYGIGSSQYNRIKIPACEVGGDHNAVIEYKRLGLSEGFGSYHFSRETLSIIDDVLTTSEDGRRVNFIFGEGVNPRMRHIRDAIGAIGLPADLILKHGTKRVVYAVPLAHNFREVLLGMDEKPKYLIPLSRPRARTELISSYWRKRWLSKRVENGEILSAVSRHTASCPISHGARVSLLKLMNQNQRAEYSSGKASG